MQGMTLQELAAACGGDICGDASLTVTEISTDTRTIKPGCLYLPIRGERFDGHDFIPDAVAKGAAAVMSDHPVDAGCPVIIVDDTRLAYGAAASAYRMRFELFVVGITGSVGKTSTKEMTACILDKTYHVHKTQGNFNNDIGLPKTLLELREEHTAAVFEMGMSALGEISCLSKLCRPDVGIITNIGVSHMETLGSRENILRAKLELLDGMKPDSTIILNGDDEYLCSLRSKLGPRARYYTVHGAAECCLSAEDIRQEGDATRFVFVYEGKKYPAVVPAVGIHNVQNALAGFLAGIEAGIKPEQIAEAVGEFRNAGMRQSIREYNGIKVIADCYNASPDSMRSALDVIRSVSCSGRRIAVLGDMLELGAQSPELHYETGKSAAGSGIDALYCVGERAFHLASGAQHSGLGEIYCERTPEPIARKLRENLRQGDAVIFKASRGMHFEQLIETVFQDVK